MLSQAVEDYLKIIYKLQGDGAASTSEIARALGVSPASVTSMTRRLSELGLANYESYRGVSLTESGTKIALEIIRHHRLLETYLKEVLGYPWDKMHEEAEHLEHHISEAFEDKIEELLGYPTHDPHGDPIPTRDGQIAETALDSLLDAPAGSRVRVRRVSDEDADVLHYLEDVGLLPGAVVRVIAKAPFDGPLTLEIDGTEQVVGSAIAQQIYVAEASAPEGSQH
ncbi:MAG: metal-dependent transcriptional regulator [Rhodothermales bacterium]|nr:metal-dependent transcriptional regulator [Rhodothermales bacterium]